MMDWWDDLPKNNKKIEKRIIKIRLNYTYGFLGIAIVRFWSPNSICTILVSGISIVTIKSFCHCVAQFWTPRIYIAHVRRFDRVGPPWHSMYCKKISQSKSNNTHDASHA